MNRRDELQRGSARAKLLVDRMDERMRFGRLVRSDMHQRAAVICSEIRYHLPTQSGGPDGGERCRIPAASAMTT